MHNSVLHPIYTHETLLLFTPYSIRQLPQVKLLVSKRKGIDKEQKKVAQEHLFVCSFELVVDFLEIISAGCKYGIDKIARYTFKKVSTEPMVLLGMRYDRLYRCAAFEFWVSSFVLRCLDDYLRLARIAVSSIALVGKEIRDALIGECLKRCCLRC